MANGHTPPGPGKRGLGHRIKSFAQQHFRSRSGALPNSHTARAISTISLPESPHPTGTSDISLPGTQPQIVNLASGSSQLNDPTSKWEEDTKTNARIHPQTPMTDHNTGSTARPIASEPSVNKPEWRENGKEGLAVASRFVQTLLKKAPDCVDGNPVKMAMSIVKMVIEIKDEIGDNDDKLQQELRDTEDVRRVVGRAITLGVPKAVEEKLKTFEEAIEKEVEAYKSLLQKQTITKILDYEKLKTQIQVICQQLNKATINFQLEMVISIQTTSSKILDSIKKADLLRLSPSRLADHRTDVEHQSIMRQECTLGTRVDILKEITDWAMDLSGGARIFWLAGQAGAGKTTIAYTLAKQFEIQPRSKTTLGANFLCSRQFAQTRQRRHIIPTVAYQLARKCPSYADALHAVDKFDSVDQMMPIQMQDLLVQPWLQSGSPLEKAPPLLVIIDGLDELEGNGGSMFLSELIKVIGDLGRLKFLVVSRLEPEIVAICEKFGSEHIRLLQDVPADTVRKDIDRFLRKELPNLADSAELAEVGGRAGTLFIYAATVVKYLTRGRNITPEEQKEKLRRLLSRSHDEKSAKQATFLLDDLYQHIIFDAFGEYEGMFRKDRLCVLYTILCTEERTSPSVLSALVNVVPGKSNIVTGVLDSLYAVVYKRDDRIFWYHESFPDFMFDPKRSCFTMQGQTFDITCNRALHHSFLTRSCFRIMRAGLHFNMAQLASSYSLDRNVRGVTRRVANVIHPPLSYACQYWATHMLSSVNHEFEPPTSETFTKEMQGHSESLKSFLDNEWLFWLEGMNLLREPNMCQSMLETALAFYNQTEDGMAPSQLRDAYDFVSQFINSPVSQSTPQLYLSALVAWGHDSPLIQRWRKKFSMTFTNSFTYDLLNNLPLTIPNTLTTMRIVHSSGGVKFLASLINDDLAVWDGLTGDQTRYINGIGCLINAVSLSPSGSHVAFGADDCSLGRLSLVSKESAPDFVLNTHPVKSVTFSLDARLLASGSSDGTLMMWDSDTRVSTELLHPDALSDSVESLAFSPDGMKIVSGHANGAVIVTNILNKQVSMELKGHTDLVNAIAFSSDACFIVSGSRDGMIKLWDACNGQHMMDLAGHTADIWSIAFSDDSQQVHSSSVDSAVKIWDTTTGQLVDEFTAETVSIDVFPVDNTQHIVSLPRQYLRVKCGLCVKINRRIVDSMPGTNWASCYTALYIIIFSTWGRTPILPSSRLFFDTRIVHLVGLFGIANFM